MSRARRLPPMPRWQATVRAERAVALAAAPRAAAGVRPARSDDVEALARLIVQNWRLEMPGVLAAGDAKTEIFLVRHLLAQSAARVQGMYVLDSGGRVVAAGGLATRARPRPFFYRPGAFRDIHELAGTRVFLRLVWPIVRNATTQLQELEDGTAYIHSFVVDEPDRRCGLGASLLDGLEAEARAAGCERVAVQVLTPTATSFWAHRGYVEHARYPERGIARLLGIGSVLMRKQLLEEEQ